MAGLAVVLGTALGAISHRLRWAPTAAWVTVAVCFTTVTHIVVIRQSTADGFRAAQLVAGAPLTRVHWATEPWVLMPTTHVFNNQASWLAVPRAWPWGVGPGGHNPFVEVLQHEQAYPLTIGLTDPHSTYFGAAAELRTAGLIALLLLLSTVGFTIVRLVRDQSIPRWTAASYAGAGAVFLIEAIANDLMNCRHYWWQIAVVASWEPCTRRPPTHRSSSVP